MNPFEHSVDVVRSVYGTIGKTERVAIVASYLVGTHHHERQEHSIEMVADMFQPPTQLAYDDPRLRIP